MDSYKPRFFAILPPGRKSRLFLEVFLRIRTNMSLVWEESDLNKNPSTLIIEFFGPNNFSQIRERILYTKKRFPTHKYIAFGPRLFGEQKNEVEKLGLKRYFDYYVDLNFVVNYCKELNEKDTILEYGGITLNLINRFAEVSGQRIKLRNKEFELLKYFLRQPKTVISSLELLENIWGYNVHVVTNTLRSHISSVRRKLKKYVPQKVIHTLPKQGYMLS